MEQDKTYTQEPMPIRKVEDQVCINTEHLLTAYQDQTKELQDMNIWLPVSEQRTGHELLNQQAMHGNILSSYRKIVVGK